MPRSLNHLTSAVKPFLLGVPENKRMDTFGRRLRAQRKARGWTMPELAKRAHCLKQNIFDIESGKQKECKMLLLYELADALQVSPRWLATGEGTQRNTGPMSDEERDLIFLIRGLPDGHRKYLLERAEALAVEAKPETLHGRPVRGRPHNPPLIFFAFAVRNS